MPALDITGQRFNRLVACKPTDERRNRSVVWVFRCDCGNEVRRVASEVVRGKISSCGCLHSEVKSREITANNLRRTIHGHMRRGVMRSPTLISWENMHQRCRTPGHKSYKAYGGAGVTICERWSSFKNFLDDMGERPEGATLDRIIGTKGYEPGNCRWATPKEQTNNIRTNRRVTLNGRTQNLKQWAEELGISHQCLRHRLAAGWTDEQILNTPVDHANGWKLERR